MELWHKIVLGLIGLTISAPFGYISIMNGIIGGVIVSIISTIICALYCYYVLQLDEITVGIISSIFFFMYIPVSYIIFALLIAPIIF